MFDSGKICAINPDHSWGVLKPSNDFLYPLNDQKLTHSLSWSEFWSEVKWNARFWKAAESANLFVGSLR